MSFQNCVDDCESRFKEAEAACKTLQKQLLGPCLASVKAAFAACCKKCADEHLAPGPGPAPGDSGTTPVPPTNPPAPAPAPAPNPPTPPSPEYWAEVVQPGKTRLVHHGEIRACFQIFNNGGGALKVIVDGEELEEISMGATSACHCGKDIRVKAGTQLAAYTPIPCKITKES